MRERPPSLPPLPFTFIINKLVHVIIVVLGTLLLALTALPAAVAALPAALATLAAALAAIRGALSALLVSLVVAGAALAALPVTCSVALILGLSPKLPGRREVGREVQRRCISMVERNATARVQPQLASCWRCEHPNVLINGTQEGSIGAPS